MSKTATRKPPKRSRRKSADATDPDAAASQPAKRKPRKPRATDPRAEALRIVQKREALLSKAAAHQAQADNLTAEAEALTEGINDTVGRFVSMLVERE